MTQIDEWTGNGWPQGFGPRMRYEPNYGTQLTGTYTTTDCTGTYSGGYNLTKQ